MTHSTMTHSMRSTSTSELPFGSPCNQTYNSAGERIEQNPATKTDEETKKVSVARGSCTNGLVNQLKQIIKAQNGAKTFVRRFGKLIHFGVLNDGVAVNAVSLLPDIYEVKVIHNEAGENIGVKIYFVDNSCEKAMVSGTDTFDLERGIELCMVKRILSYSLEKSAGKSAKESGSALLAKVVEYGMKFYDKQEKSKVEAQKAKEEFEALEKRRAEKKRKKAEKRKAKKREEAIEIKKEAILRAYREMGVIGDVKDVGEVPAQE